MKINKKKMMKISICLIIVFVAVFLGFSIREHIHKNYISREIFESIDYIYRYEAFTRERSGEYEERIVYMEDEFPVWLVDCGDIRVLYCYNIDNGTVLDFMYAQTTDSSYLFGKKGIRVGMDRDEVENILKNSKKSSPHPNSTLVIDDTGETGYQDVFGYYDDIYDYGLGFTYDDKDKVSRIFAFLGL